MKEQAQLILSILFMLFMLYFGIASVVFMFRHPMCNQTVIITHFTTVITFQTVPKYQEK